MEKPIKRPENCGLKSRIRKQPSAETIEGVVNTVTVYCSRQGCEITPMTYDLPLTMNARNVADDMVKLAQPNCPLRREPDTQ